MDSEDIRTLASIEMYYEAVRFSISKKGEGLARIDGDLTTLENLSSLITELKTNIESIENETPVALGNERQTLQG